MTHTRYSFISTGADTFDYKIEIDVTHQCCFISKQLLCGQFSVFLFDSLSDCFSALSVCLNVFLCLFLVSFSSVPFFCFFFSPFLFIFSCSCDYQEVIYQDVIVYLWTHILLNRFCPFWITIAPFLFVPSQPLSPPSVLPSKQKKMTCCLWRRTEFGWTTTLTRTRFGSALSIQHSQIKGSFGVDKKVP